MISSGDNHRYCCLHTVPDAAFSEKRNAVTEIGNGRDRLVQSILGILVCGGGD